MYIDSGFFSCFSHIKASFPPLRIHFLVGNRTRVAFSVLYKDRQEVEERTHERAGGEKREEKKSSKLVCSTHNNRGGGKRVRRRGGGGGSDGDKGWVRLG